MIKLCMSSIPMHLVADHQKTRSRFMRLSVVHHTTKSNIMHLWVVHQDTMCRLTKLENFPKNMSKAYTLVNYMSLCGAIVDELCEVKDRDGKYSHPDIFQKTDPETKQTLT